VISGTRPSGKLFNWKLTICEYGYWKSEKLGVLLVLLLDNIYIRIYMQRWKGNRKFGRENKIGYQVTKGFTVSCAVCFLLNLLKVIHFKSLTCHIYFDLLKVIHYKLKFIWCIKLLKWITFSKFYRKMCCMRDCKTIWYLVKCCRMLQYNTKWQIKWLGMSMSLLGTQRYILGIISRKLRYLASLWSWKCQVSAVFTVTMCANELGCIWWVFFSLSQCKLPHR
jgi:hypothetical protein